MSNHPVLPGLSGKVALVTGGSRGITVNNVQPGPTDTDMNPADGPFASQVRETIAVQRYGSGEEIAGLVAYLAGPEAAFITGASFRIDGGASA